MVISKARVLYAVFVAVLFVIGLISVAFAATLQISLNGNFDLTYSGIVKGIKDGNLISMIIWVLKDVTEPQFWASFFATIGLYTGAFIAHILDKRKSKYAGFNICYGTHLFPKVFVTEIAVAFLSSAAYIRLVPITGWWPTFVAIVSVPVAVVFKTNGNWKFVIPSIIIGGLFTPALARGIQIAFFATVPNVGAVAPIWNVAAMGIISWMMLEIIYRLPGSPTANPPKETKVEVNDPPSASSNFGAVWFIRRVLADLSEPQFLGNEWASIGLIIGGILTWLIIPGHQYYGNPWWPLCFLLQLLTVAIGIALYRGQYMKLGWFATFVPAVSIVPGTILFYSGYPDWVVITAGLINAVFGGIIGGPIAQFINDRLPKHQHGVVGCVLSMAITTSLCGLVTSFLLLYPWGIA